MANTAETIIDTQDRAVIKLINDGTNEASVLRVNASLLDNAKVSFLTNAGTVTGDFTIGETVTQTTSGATARVISSDNATKTVVLSIVAQNPPVNFTTSDAIVGDDSATSWGATWTLSDVGLFEFAIMKIWWSINAATTQSVSVEWDATANNEAVILQGNGFWNLKGVGNIIPSPAGLTGATGDIAVTTNGTWVATDSYTIILELRKVKGYNHFFGV